MVLNAINYVPSSPVRVRPSPVRRVRPLRARALPLRAVSEALRGRRPPELEEPQDAGAVRLSAHGARLQEERHRTLPVHAGRGGEGGQAGATIR